MPELLLLKIFHYPTITATSGPPPLISQLFHAVFFYSLAVFVLIQLADCFIRVSRSEGVRLFAVCLTTVKGPQPLKYVQLMHLA